MYTFDDDVVYILCLAGKGTETLENAEQIYPE